MNVMQIHFVYRYSLYASTYWLQYQLCEVLIIGRYICMQIRKVHSINGVGINGAGTD